jgi:hypothetical protein
VALSGSARCDVSSVLPLDYEQNADPNLRKPQLSHAVSSPTQG